MKSAPQFAPRFDYPPKPEISSHQPAVQKPAKPVSRDDLCPCCQRALPGSEINVWGLLRRGLMQLVGAIFMIVAGIVRCLRFAVAGLLCLIGLFGSFCSSLAKRVAHRDDRKLLFRH